jgi:hypothetical protein
VVDHLPSKLEALALIPSTMVKKRKKERNLRNNIHSLWDTVLWALTNAQSCVDITTIKIGKDIL